MDKFYGAAYDLDELVTCNLFIISPNNSGSTFLNNIFSTSAHTWNLKREGQHTYGFSGPIPLEENAALLWASKSKLIDKFSSHTAYNWTTTKKAWYFQSFSKNETASVFIEKSPPSLLRVDQLKNNFTNPKFIFLVRNPYAVVEGIYRRFKNRSKDDVLSLAAKHIVNCFYYQKKNVEDNYNLGIFFTYEDMCSNPKPIEEKIKSFMPVLDDIKLEQKVPVKGLYDEMLRDMNHQQISRLTKKEIFRINRIFKPNEGILNHFGYKLL